MTRVEEWTKADTGVGAAMAAGSHLENGIWALLVIAANMIVRIRYVLSGEDHINVMFQWDIFRTHAIEINRRTSPIRFVKAVIIPAASDLLFW